MTEMKAPVARAETPDAKFDASCRVPLLALFGGAVAPPRAAATIVPRARNQFILERHVHASYCFFGFILTYDSSG